MLRHPAAVGAALPRGVKDVELHYHFFNDEVEMIIVSHYAFCQLHFLTRLKKEVKVAYRVVLPVGKAETTHAAKAATRTASFISE